MNELEVHQRPAYADYPVDYFVPDFGMSHEMVYTQNSIKNAEEKLNHEIKASWKDDKNPGNPRDYFVPNFGVDEEIKYAQEGLDWAEDDLHHIWTPTQDANGYWNVPEAASNDSYSYNGDSGFTNHLAGAVY